MTSNEILHANFLDILFENRNKQYGAYALRKNYNGRLAFSLGLAIALTLSFFLLMRFTNISGKTIAHGAGFIVRTIPLPPDNIKPKVPDLPKHVSQRKSLASVQSTTPIIIDREVVQHDVPDQLLPGDKISADQAGGGDAAGQNDLPQQQSVPVDAKKDPPVFAPIQREPEFPGGMHAWSNFLNKYLHVPGELEPGEKRSVMIRFKVSEDGTVTDFEIVQSGGSLYDNEVLRVLKKMPKWKPAIQNNEPVARSFTQPVSFMGLGD